LKKAPVTQVIGAFAFARRLVPGLNAVLSFAPGGTHHLDPTNLKLLQRVFPGGASARLDVAPGGVRRRQP
jgi:hypothetical protein